MMKSLWNKWNKSSTFAAVLSVGLLGTALSGCTNAYYQESTGQYIDSSAITLKVKSRLAADKQIKSVPITVKTYKNVVQLSGFVDNRYQKNRAVEIARNVPGVVGVQDALVIKRY